MIDEQAAQYKSYECRAEKKRLKTTPYLTGFLSIKMYSKNVYTLSSPTG